ncbi:hypothetical protein ISS21_02965, partial [Patescibacteria group bacterium]|nr:hypothetical protein [Patescibacteria group bacterium]
MITFILVTLLLLSSAPVFNQAVFLDQAINKDSPEISFPASLGPKLTAESALVVDLEIGETVFTKNPEKVLPIASITKLMTAIVFLENKTKEWDEEVLVEAEDLVNGLE